MLNPDILNRRALIKIPCQDKSSVRGVLLTQNMGNKLVERGRCLFLSLFATLIFSTIVSLSLMFTATTSSAQTAGRAGPDQTVAEGAKVTLRAELGSGEMFVAWGPFNGDLGPFSGISLPSASADPYIFTAPSGLSENRILIVELTTILLDGFNTDTVTITVTADPTDPDPTDPDPTDPDPTDPDPTDPDPTDPDPTDPDPTDPDPTDPDPTDPDPTDPDPTDPDPTDPDPTDPDPTDPDPTDPDPTDPDPTDVSVQKTVDMINGFLGQRTNLILASQPKLSRQINRLQQDVGSEQLSFATGEVSKLKPFEFNFLSLGTGNYKLATSLDQVTRAADHLQVTTGGQGTHERRRFDVWFEGSFNKFNGTAGTGGDFAIAYLGADYLVSPDLLLGALVQYDSLSYNSSSEDSRIEGKGWMAGPYVTARLQDNLYLDARLAWGTSDNEISPPGANYTDSFTSTRQLANISLSGEFTQGQWIIRPNASLSYLTDTQRAYTNTQGDTIPGQTVSSGQLRFGPNVSTQFTGANGWRYEPSFTLDAVYSHAGTSGGLSTTPSPQDGWRARLEAGLGMTISETSRLSFTGNYDGIGQGGFKAWGLGFNLDTKF